MTPEWKTFEDLIREAKLVAAKSEFERLMQRKYSFEAEYDPISLEDIPCPRCGGRALKETFYQHEMIEDFGHKKMMKEIPYNASVGFPRHHIVKQVRCREWLKNCYYIERTEGELCQQDTSPDMKKEDKNTEPPAPCAGHNTPFSIM